MTTLEENSGSGGNSSIDELEVRVEVLESTTNNLETRLTIAEANLEGISGFVFEFDILLCHLIMYVVLLSFI